MMLTDLIFYFFKDDSFVFCIYIFIFKNLLHGPNMCCFINSLKMYRLDPCCNPKTHKMYDFFLVHPGVTFFSMMIMIYRKGFFFILVEQLVRTSFSLK